MKNPLKRRPSVSRVLKTLAATITQLEALTAKAAATRSANEAKMGKIAEQNAQLSAEIDHAQRVSKKLADLLA